MILHLRMKAIPLAPCLGATHSRRRAHLLAPSHRKRMRQLVVSTHLLAFHSCLRATSHLKALHYGCGPIHPFNRPCPGSPSHIVPGIYHRWTALGGW